MGEHRPNPIPLKTLPAPIARLLPTVLEYTRLTRDSGGSVGADARRSYDAHVLAMKAFLAALGKIAEITRGRVKPLITRCGLMAGLVGDELGDALSDLIAGVQSVYGSHRKSLKQVFLDHPDLFHDLYRDVVSPVRILVVHADDTWPEAESLRTRLIDRCWYDPRSCREHDGVPSLADVDMVLLAPGPRPIRPDFEAGAVEADVAIIALIGVDAAADPASMASLRTEHRYRRSGYRVLRRPFAPVRLYQALDVEHMRNLARRTTTPALALAATT